MPGEPPASPRSTGSAFTVLVGVALLALVGFFVASVVAISARWIRVSNAVQAPARRAPVVTPRTVTTPSRNAPTSVAAFVVIKRELRPGVLLPGMVRPEPGPNKKPAFQVQSGTRVDIIDTAMVEETNGPNKWYLIRWVDGGTTHEGWMHSDILISAVEGVPLP